MPTAVLTAVGADHPGILDEVTEHLLAQGGSVTEVRMARLHGHTALLLHVDADDAAMTRLRGGLPSLSGRVGLRVELHDTPARPDFDGRPMRLAVHPSGGSAGASPVLRQVSNLMRVLRVNIVDVQLDDASANWRLDVTLDVPAEVPEDKARELVGQLLEPAGVAWDLASC